MTQRTVCGWTLELCDNIALFAKATSRAQYRPLAALPDE
jgi:hypothetical protein